MLHIWKCYAFGQEVPRREQKDLKRLNWLRKQSKVTEQQRDSTSSSGWNTRIWPRYGMSQGITMIKKPSSLLKRGKHNQGSQSQVRSWLSVINSKEVTVFVEGFCLFNQCNNHHRALKIRHSQSQFEKTFWNIWFDFSSFLHIRQSKMDSKQAEKRMLFSQLCLFYLKKVEQNKASTSREETQRCMQTHVHLVSEMKSLAWTWTVVGGVHTGTSLKAQKHLKS